MVDYYTELLGRKQIHRVRAFNSFLKDGRILDITKQFELIRPYTEKEVKQAMFSIDKNKSPGPATMEALQGYGFPDSFTSLVMTCVTITKFVVKVNGDGFRYFEERRGIRQSDPMSPLLFVLVMEYLTRSLNKMSELSDFRFHPMCKRTKLAHLIFADDLMILCKAHEKSITRVMEVLNHLTDATGLVAINDKSRFYCAGVNDETKKKFLRLTKFLAGTLPITYLGLPLSSKKWSKVDCHVLVEKITNKVTMCYSKSLSYAGRL
ncbi:hypothetical protein MTR67_002211 [Solanum verrucosum]|uniref:Reverse transcriptase domain-containing protein n=1 Tax=Solanum verrucosum TaxID=315347 RepID=A0AAF0T866_SOLVR|nr:hypothetical protein MTR67_002211 [Solanum verrucosum]